MSFHCPRCHNKNIKNPLQQYCGKCNGERIVEHLMEKAKSMTDTNKPAEAKKRKVHLCPECGKKCKIMKTVDDVGRLVDRWRQCICGWTCHPKGKRLPWSV